MSDSPFYAPNHADTIRPREPNPGEPLFAFVRTHDDAHFTCELRDRGPYGVEAQFFLDGTFLESHRFPSRELAIEWAEGEREQLLHAKEEW